MATEAAIDTVSPAGLEESAAIALDRVSVRYRSPFERRVTLKEWLLRPSARRRAEEFVALDSVDLAVRRGEVVGVIGVNGAGKTTLLNVMARVQEISSGRLRIRGRVAALIDLVAGFHPELTGRENALLRMAMLGVSRRDAKSRIAAIASFADVGRFMEAPIRTWSAGMTARLAFAISTSVEADVLLIDEVLGTGDAEFQVKCARRIDEYRAGRVTFVIVSHDHVRLAAMADRIVWLERGVIVAEGSPADMIARYREAHG